MGFIEITDVMVYFIAHFAKFQSPAIHQTLIRVLLGRYLIYVIMFHDLLTLHEVSKFNQLKGIKSRTVAWTH